MKKRLLKNCSIYVSAGFLCLIVVAMVALFIGMMGKTDIYSDNIANIKTESVTCVGKLVDYPKLPNTYNASMREISINLFFENEKVTTIGLIYTWTYNSSENANKAKDLLLGDYRKAVADAGFGEVDAINEKFTVYKSNTILNLYAEGKEINERSAPFLLIDLDGSGQIAPRSKSQYKSNYERKNFSCKNN